MVFDISAIIAIIQNEPGSDRLVKKIEEADSLKISAATVVEAGIVMFSRYGDAGELEIDQFLYRLGVTVVPVTVDQAERARTAYRKFGKGVDPAGLNFGDCFSYALASSLDEPLLYVGNNFEKTDPGGSNGL